MIQRLDDSHYLPDPITESELLQLNVGDTFYEIELGIRVTLEMTQAAERNFPSDTGWVFKGKIVDLESSDIEKPKEDLGREIEFFISDGAGFDYTGVCLTSKYPYEQTKDNYSAP